MRFLVLAKQLNVVDVDDDDDATADAVAIWQTTYRDRSSSRSLRHCYEWKIFLIEFN